MMICEETQEPCNGQLTKACCVTLSVFRFWLGLEITLNIYFFDLLFFHCSFFSGDKLLDIPTGRNSKAGAEPTQHFTVIFNTFVMMTLFNEINARKIHGQRNVFEGLFTNPIFYCIWIGTALSQVIDNTTVRFN